MRPKPRSGADSSPPRSPAAASTARDTPTCTGSGAHRSNAATDTTSSSPRRPAACAWRANSATRREGQVPRRNELTRAMASTLDEIAQVAAWSLPGGPRRTVQPEDPDRFVAAVAEQRISGLVAAAAENGATRFVHARVGRTSALDTSRGAAYVPRRRSGQRRGVRPPRRRRHPPRHAQGLRHLTARLRRPVAANDRRRRRARRPDVVLRNARPPRPCRDPTPCAAVPHTMGAAVRQGHPTPGSGRTSKSTCTSASWAGTSV